MKPSAPSRRALLATAATFMAAGLFAARAPAQFVGPTQTGIGMTVEEARIAPVETKVVVTGWVVAHLREDYYAFRDPTGETYVRITEPVWAGRPVGTDTKVRLTANVARDQRGLVHLSVEVLEIVE